MKKLVLLAFCLVYVLIANAGSVTEQQALQKARQFMPGKNLSLSPISGKSGLDFGGVTPFYVYRAEGNAGFVIVSGDDRTKPILGYSDKGSIDLNNLPENVKWWLGYYAEAITVLQNSGIEPRTATQTARIEIKPLLKTTWDQDSPYWDQCVFDGVQCLTGCVATATAQVLNYYQYPSKVAAIDAYTCDYSIPALPGATLSWSNMCNNYTGNETKAQKKAVATLMRYCGQSVFMDYGPDGSGTATAYVPLALVKYFNYNKSTHVIHRDGYDANGWEKAIYYELATKNPVIYAGQDDNGGGGHCFVTDGYKDGLFHVNWGWGGACDGYFVLTVMDANSHYTFSDDQEAIVGVKAKSGGSLDYPLLTIGALEARSETVTRSSSSDDFSFDVFWKLKPSVNEEGISVDYYLGLYKGDELLQAFLGYSLDLNPLYYWQWTDNISFGSDLADGTYTLCAIYQDADGQVKKAFAADYRYVKVVKKGNMLTLSNYPFYGGVKLNKTKATIAKGKTITLKASLAPAELSDKSVTWKSSNTKVATVTSDGVVKGLKAGTATITCTSSTGQSATCKVTVGYVSLDKTQLTLQMGKTVTLTSTVYPSSLTDKSVTWTSSNPRVATVTSDGKVKGVNTGLATIKCTSVATGLSTTCKVTVGSVNLSESKVTIKKGSTVTLTATVYPTSLSDKSVTWKSSDTKVATVTSKGKVKGIKAGTATITCTSNATGLSSTCKVTVKASSGTRSLDGDDDGTTDIEIMDENPAFVEPFDVYDLSGRKVAHQVTTLDGLPRGIYIVNGKKMLKK